MKTAPTMLIRMHSCSQRVSRIRTENRSIVQARVLLANPIVTAVCVIYFETNSINSLQHKFDLGPFRLIRIYIVQEENLEDIIY